MTDVITGIPNVFLLAVVGIGAYCLYTGDCMEFDSEPAEDTDEE
jgi:hypothetical protein